MDNEKINGVPEEEAEVAEVQETEEAAETLEETAQEASEEVSDTETAEEVNENPEETEESEETDSESEPEEEVIDEDELCALCGEKRAEEDSCYCADCEGTMLSRKIPFLGWLGGLAAIVMSVFALALAVVVAAPSIQIARGDGLAKDNCWYSAYREYTNVPSVVAELNSILGEESPFIKTGSGLNYKIIDTVANSYSPLEAIMVADSLLGENSVENHFALREYKKIREDYRTSYEALQSSIEAMTLGEATAEETYAAFEAVKGTQGVSDLYVDYFLYNASVFYKEDASVKLNYLDAVDKLAKESKEDYSWLYYQDYANTLFEAGENEKAMEIIALITQKDRTKFGAYELQLRIAITSGDMETAAKVVEEFKEYNEGYDTAYVLESTYLRATGKTEEAKLLLTDALEQYDTVPELHRQMALIYLLEGDYANAYESVFMADNTAYYLYAYMGDSSAYTPQLDNTLYLCAYLAKENGVTTENSAWIDDILKDFTEADLSEEAVSVIKGQKTVTEVLTEGAYDLA